jgi:Icc protein
VKKLLQISDLHVQPRITDTLLGINTEHYFHQVLQHAQQNHGPFDLILISGDLTQDPCPDSYQRILEKLQSYQTPTVCLPGNHDDWQLMQTILNQGVVSCRKQLILDDWQIICLNSQKDDSPTGYLNQDELNFLTDCLKTNLPSLIAVHHHSLSINSSWMDGMMIENSQEFLAIISQYPQVKILTNGHVHQIIAENHQGLAVFSAPATCIQFMPQATEFTVTNTPPGYRVFELLADGSFNSNCYRIDEQLIGLQTNLHHY